MGKIFLTTDLKPNVVSLGLFVPVSSEASLQAAFVQKALLDREVISIFVD